jgi:hypothetical protein
MPLVPPTKTATIPGPRVLREAFEARTISNEMPFMMLIVEGM